MTAVDAQVLGPGPLPDTTPEGGAPPVVITGEDPAVPVVTPRDRLLGAAVKVFARLGYEKATIADIVREARVSRRTFYENFEDKRDCLFATYDTGTELMVATVVEAVSKGSSWQERLLGGVDRFVEVTLAAPDVTRVMVNEVMAAGHDAVARRRRAHRQWAKMWIREFEAAREADPKLREISRMMTLTEAQVLVAAIQEMVILGIEAEGEPDRAEVARAVRAILVAFASMPPGEIVLDLDAQDAERHPGEDPE